MRGKAKRKAKSAAKAQSDNFSLPTKPPNLSSQFPKDSSPFSKILSHQNPKGDRITFSKFLPDYPLPVSRQQKSWDRFFKKAGKELAKSLPVLEPNIFDLGKHCGQKWRLEVLAAMDKFLKEQSRIRDANTLVMMAKLLP